ncbi:MAG: hypothetical protein QXU32_02625 [Nitrososphaerales archaeon]
MSITNIVAQIRQVLTSRTFILIFASLLVISFSIAYVASESRPQERFLSISTLGYDMTTKNYYPSDTSTIKVGDTVRWNINVYNRMGDVEYLSVRVKLLNATQAGPDPLLHVPSPENQILEMKYVLMNNSTWVIPLDWSVLKVDREEDYVTIQSLRVNDTVIDDLNVSSVDGNNFRMIIELWRYDKETKHFTFEWSSGLDEKSVWNQIWFNVR